LHELVQAAETKGIKRPGGARGDQILMQIAQLLYYSWKKRAQSSGREGLTENGDEYLRQQKKKSSTKRVGAIGLKENGGEKTTVREPKKVETKGESAIAQEGGYEPMKITNSGKKNSEKKRDLTGRETNEAGKRAFSFGVSSKGTWQGQAKHGTVASK